MYSSPEGKLSCIIKLHMKNNLPLELFQVPLPVRVTIHLNIGLPI